MVDRWGHGLSFGSCRLADDELRRKRSRGRQRDATSTREVIGPVLGLQQMPGGDWTAANGFMLRGLAPARGRA